jgi:hypothetical protein
MHAPRILWKNIGYRMILEGKKGESEDIDKKIRWETDNRNMVQAGCTKLESEGGRD